ncbi:MAG: ATP-binding protein [Acetobacterales bacterium]
MDSRLRLTLHNDLGEITRIAGEVERFCRENGLSEKVAYGLNLSFDELITNTVLYGYEDRAEHLIALDLQLIGDTLWVRMADDGVPFNPLADARRPDLEAPLERRSIGGMGIHLVRSVMDSIRYYRDGALNRLVMSLEVGRPHDGRRSA